jgi:RNA polymerase sigma-70 factor (ECF subfamily)
VDGASRTDEREAPFAGAGTPEERRRLVSRLFAEHNRALISFLTARLHCEQEARDVAQEAYVRMLQLDRPVSFHKAYLFRIAENLAVDRVRQKVVRERLTENDLLDLLHEPEQPERHALAQAELADVQKRLQELPPKCRYAFAQHVLLDRPVKEIAAKMKIGERMVRHYVVRGLAHCRAMLDGETES